MSGLVGSGRRHKNQIRPPSRHGRTREAPSIMSYINTDDVPSFGGNNNNNNNHNERRQNKTNSNKSLSQIPAIKSKYTKKPSPLDMARDLQEQDNNSSSRRPSSAERSGGGRLSYAVLDGVKGVAKGFVEMGKAAVESVLSSPSSANKRKWQTWQRNHHQNLDSLWGTAATSTTTHKKQREIDREVILCDSDSDTDGETMIPSQQKNRSESSSSSRPPPPEEGQGSFRDSVKGIFQKTPNRNLMLKDDADDGQVQEYRRTPSYMESLQPKGPPSSWPYEEEAEAEVPTRRQDTGARRGDTFDQVLGGEADTSRVSQNASALAHSIQHRKSSEPKTSPFLGIQPLNIKKVNSRKRQDDIDEKKMAHIQNRREQLRPLKSPGDSHRPIELHNESDDDQEDKKVVMLSNLVATKIPRKKRDSHNNKETQRVLETPTKPAASSERKRLTIRDDEDDDDDFWGSEQMNSTKSSSPMPSALSGRIGLVGVLPSFDVAPMESFLAKGLAESLEKDCAVSLPAAIRPLEPDENGWEPPLPPKKSVFSLTKANGKKMPKEVPKKGLPDSAKRTKPKKHKKITPGDTLRRTNDRDDERPKFEGHEDSSFRSSSTMESSRDSRGWKRNDSSPDPALFGRRKSRRLSKAIKASPELIDVCSDSEEEGGEGSDQSVQVDLGAIAVGKKVNVHGCQANYSAETGVLKLEYEIMKRGKKVKQTRELPLTPDALREFKYYRCDVAPTENDKSVPDIAIHINFIALNIVPDDSNGLARLSMYKHDGPNIKKYILLEGDGQEIDYLVDSIRKSRHGELLSKLTSGEILPYTEAWLIHQKRLQAQASHNKFLTGKKDDTLLVVYPFAGDQQEIETAAEGLKEAGGAMASSELALPERPSNEPPDDSQKQDGAQGKVRQRAHYVSLRVEDYNRLDPGEWLNDSLVDFWMQWISRSDPSLSSDFHFFTSHFYTRLSDEGPEKVESWTARKNINIFEKSLIFIPINKDLHWSLCVVVNPGAIRRDTDDEPKKDDPVPCLIFLDSLRMHTKSKVANTVRGWLNSEWKRLKTTSDVSKPFTTNTFRLFSPTVPYQDNGYDCGVFVCRYAYAIYQLRQRGFTYSDAGLYCDSEEEKKSAAFYHLITEGSEFDFDMDDISLFRDEFQTLIERLSEIHTRWKKEEKAEQRRLKASSLQEKSVESAVAEEVGPSNPLSTTSGEETTEAELAGIERTGKENSASGALDPNVQETPGENIEDGPSDTEFPAQTSILEKPRSFISLEVGQISDPAWSNEADDDSQNVV